MIAGLDKIAESGSLNFDNPTVEETTMHQRMAEQIELKQKYSEFLQAVEQSGIDVNQVCDDIPIKIGHLKEIMEYSGLTGRGNRIIPFRDIKDSRIGAAYLHTYDAAKKACDK